MIRCRLSLLKNKEYILCAKLLFNIQALSTRLRLLKGDPSGLRKVSKAERVCENEEIQAVKTFTGKILSFETKVLICTNDICRVNFLA